MDLSKGDNPARILRWNKKSIATCSKQELIQCIIHLAGQLAQAGKRLESLDTPDPVKLSKDGERIFAVDSPNAQPRELSPEEMLAILSKPLTDEEIKMMFPVFCIVCGLVEYPGEGHNFSFITSNWTRGTHCAHHSTEEVLRAKEQWENYGSTEGKGE